MNHFDPSRLLAPFVVLMAIVLLYSSRLSAGKPKETPEGLIFAIKPIYAWGRAIVVPAYMFFFLWIAWRQHQGIPWAILFLFLIAIAISLLQMPGTIILTPMAVTQRFWLQPAKTILYHEVMTIQLMQGGRTTLVLGDNRVRIRHSSNHSAPTEFQSELERRTGKRAIR
jgi:hypothetical protein